MLCTEGHGFSACYAVSGGVRSGSRADFSLVRRRRWGVFTRRVKPLEIKVAAQRELARRSDRHQMCKRVHIHKGTTPEIQKHNPPTTMRFVRYAYPTARNFAPALAGFSRSAWSGLETEIDRLFETAVGGPTPATRFPVDLYEDKNNTFVRAEIPGVNRADINVDLVDGVLNITATRKTPAATEGHAEQTVTLSRSVRIADEVQADNVVAAYENGVLTVTLPKREEAKPKKFTVEVK